MRPFLLRDRFIALANEEEQALLDSYKNLIESNLAAYNFEANYPSHANDHIERVENNIAKLIGISGLNALNLCELYIILCAIYLHDISMSLGKRLNHAKESGKLVCELDKYIIDKSLKQLIVDVIEAHGVDDLKKNMKQRDHIYHDGIYNDRYRDIKIDVGYLMALLRMGDLMDWSQHRAPSLIRDEKPVSGFSLYYWMIHSYINYINPIPKESCIYVDVSPKGPYSSLLMKETIAWFNRELQSNFRYLERNKINYQHFCFTPEADNIIENKLYSEKRSDNIFRPFQSYDADEYHELFGRDSEVNSIVKHLFDSTEDDEVKIVTGSSGVGKTSLIKSKIFNIFQEFDFIPIYLENYELSEITKCFKKILDKPNTRYLIILDQFERAENKIDILTQARSIFEKNKRVAILASTTLSDYGHLLDQLKEAGLNYSEYVLRPLDCGEVVKSLLKLYSIDFNENTINRAVDYLYKSQDDIDDISSIHIVFDKFISDENKSLLSKDSVDNLNEILNNFIQEYFSDTFDDITSNQRKILMKSCNEMGNGTVRVKRDSNDDDDIEVLRAKKIIRTYECDRSYEFSHDLLSKYFFNKVLTDEEKNIKKLVDNINYRETIDASSLRKIKKNRYVLASQIKDDSLFFKLAHSYIKTDILTYENEIQFWLNQIVSVTGLVSAILESTYNDFNYENLVCFKKCLIRYIEIHNQKEPLKKYLISFLAQEKKSYILRIVAKEILSTFVGTFFSEKGKVLSISSKYKQVCFNNRHDDLFEEMYFYLKEFNLLKNLQEKSCLPEGDLNDLKVLIENYLCGNCQLFYKYKYKNLFKKAIKNEDPAYQYLKRILNQIDDFTPPIIFKKGQLDFTKNDQLYVKTEIDGMTYVLCDLEDIKIKWIKFSINATVQLLGIETNGCVEPVCLLKEDHEFSNSFSTYDVEKIIWKSKANLLKNVKSDKIISLLKTLKKELNNAFDNKDLSINIITNFIKRHKSDIVLLYDEDSVLHFDSVIINDRIKFLFGLLNFLDHYYAGSPVSINSFDIVLTCQEIPNSKFSKAFGIFDNFYILLDEDYIIDIDNISGSYGIHNDTIRYVLLLNNLRAETSDISMACKDEIKFCGNTSSIILIHIGNSTKEIAENYRDSVSFIISLEERINAVSKAIDAWEYEILKIFYVLKNNNFVNTILVVGDKTECKKTASFIETFTDEGNSNSDERYDFTGIEIFIEKSEFCELLNNIRVTFIPTSSTKEADLLLEIDRFFVDQYKNILPTKNESINHDFSLENIEVLKEISIRYLEKHHPNFRANQNISHNNLNILHKCMIAELICLGKMKNDSHGKETVDLGGISLTLNMPTSKNDNVNHLHFRRNEISEYFENQWVNKNGEISKYIDSNYHFNVNQKEAMFDILEKSILEKKNTRKISFTFYNPNILMRNPNGIPSLFSIFILPEFIEKTCYLNSYFVWRTNECVFGLPLSLEACYKWVAEVLILELEKRLRASDHTVTIGSYTYLGISMHMYHNNIMYEMVKKLLSE
jgi:GTPase SAR1 family protein